MPGCGYAARPSRPYLPVKLRFATREQASPFDLEAATRQALVALFTDGTGIAHTLDGTESDQAAGLEHALRELRTWPRLCLVDFSPPELDLPDLAARLGLTCIAPAGLPAWPAGRETPGPLSDPLPITDLETRLWATACALPRLPVTLAQARDLYQALGLPPAWRLPAPTAGYRGADGIRFSDGERRGLLADLARWVREDGPSSKADRCLKTALDFWETRLAANTANLEQLHTPPPAHAGRTAVPTTNRPLSASCSACGGAISARPRPCVISGTATSSTTITTRICSDSSGESVSVWRSSAPMASQARRATGVSSYPGIGGSSRKLTASQPAPATSAYCVWASPVPSPAGVRDCLKRDRRP